MGESRESCIVLNLSFWCKECVWNIIMWNVVVWCDMGWCGIEWGGVVWCGISQDM